MTLRYITVDHFARVLEVSHLRDCFDKPTVEPLLAERCIVSVGDELIAMTTIDIPIYTVH